MISSLDLAQRGFALIAGPDGEGWTNAAGAPGIALAAYRLGSDLLGDVPGFMVRTGLSPQGALLIGRMASSHGACGRWSTIQGRC